MKLMDVPLVLRELGIQPVVLNALYRLKLLSGYYRLVTPPAAYEDWKKLLQPKNSEPEFINKLLIASRPGDAGRKQIIAAADEILQGNITLYGGLRAPLQFKTHYIAHWTSYESGRVESGVADIKDIWEPARFSWVCILAQAYHLNKEDNYPGFFWEQLKIFLANNPPNIGPNWMNGQEIALRMIALAFAWQAFKESPETTRERVELLQCAIAAHAQRIITTLIYARAQRNNHLLSEAAGLYTAGLLLPELPDAALWKETGWKLLVAGWLDQIAGDGSYIQQSVNYHRLMLQLAIWVKALAPLKGSYSFPAEVDQRIISAIWWLDALILSEDGHAPNMGSNDGANILPLGGVDQADYRPVLQIAKCFYPSETTIGEESPQQVIIMKDDNQAACMRVAHYQGRPSHADQLHLDLWWKNRNIGLDAGTYRYSHAPPWGNALAGTAVHNTITVDDGDQMLRAGRFLWLRHANIRNLVINRDTHLKVNSICAEHDGYQQLGAMHKRTVTAKPDGKPGWLIEDDILPLDGIPTSRMHSIRLTWLLPDWDWEVDKQTLKLVSPEGVILLRFEVNGLAGSLIGLDIYRAGEVLTSARVSNPIWGWYSPTYGVKEPALAVHLLVEDTLPVQLTTHWRLPR